MKAIIRKVDDRWYVIRQRFGFSPHIEVLEFNTHKEAIDATDSKHGTSNCDAMCTWTPEYDSWSYFRTNNFPMRIT